nr:transposase [Gemmiger sp. An50]
MERYRRRESSVQEVLIAMYLAGVSVRHVERYYRGPMDKRSIA